MTPLTVETRHGQANVHLHPAEAPCAALVLGHGAGGGVSAPDLLAATAAALAVGVSVALVEQPYRVAGRRSPAPAHQLDAAWIDVIDELRAGELQGLRLVVGGRSSGARVACRTAATTRAVGVLCLAFPLQPPLRAGSRRRDRARHRAGCTSSTRSRSPCSWCKVSATGSACRPRRACGRFSRFRATMA